MRKRRQIMLDQPVQGTLMKRVTTYWGLCIGSTVLMSCLWTLFSNPGRSFSEWATETFPELIIALSGSLVFLPLAWADMIRLGNRIVAPVHSIRTSIRRILLGDNVPPVSSRPDDFWQDLTEQFNRLTDVATFSGRPIGPDRLNDAAGDRPNIEHDPASVVEV